MDLRDFFWCLLMFAYIAIPVCWKVSACFRYIVKMTAFYLCIIGAAVFSLPVVLFRPFNSNNYRTVGWLFLKLTAWTKVKWEVRGMEHFEKDKACVIVCNHQSSIDLMGMMEVLPDRCVALIKKELLYAGPFGLAAMLSGSVFIDRYNTKNAVELISKTVDKVKANKLKLWVFPEGTRFHEKGGMLPFKKGGFHLAVQAEDDCLDGFVIAQVLPPMSTENVSKDDVTRLSENVRETMLETFHVISEEAENGYKNRRKTP